MRIYVTKEINLQEQSKVYFEHHELLAKSINDRVRSENLALTVDKLNHSTVVRCDNCHPTSILQQHVPMTRFV